MFFGDINDKENASVTFVPTQSVYVYDILRPSDSSADDASPTGAASFGSPFSEIQKCVSDDHEFV